jgi:hypothetical protein
MDVIEPKTLSSVLLGAIDEELLQVMGVQLRNGGTGAVSIDVY